MARRCTPPHARRTAKERGRKQAGSNSNAHTSRTAAAAPPAAAPAPAAPAPAAAAAPAHLPPRAQSAPPPACCLARRTATPRCGKPFCHCWILDAPSRRLRGYSLHKQCFPCVLTIYATLCVDWLTEYQIYVIAFYKFIYRYGTKPCRLHATAWYAAFDARCSAYATHMICLMGWFRCPGVFFRANNVKHCECCLHKETDKLIQQPPPPHTHPPPRTPPLPPRSQLQTHLLVQLLNKWEQACATAPTRTPADRYTGGRCVRAAVTHAGFHYRLYEVVSLRRCVLPYKYRKIVEMLLKLMNLCEIMGSRLHANGKWHKGNTQTPTPTPQHAKQTYSHGHTQTHTSHHSHRLPTTYSTRHKRLTRKDPTIVGESAATPHTPERPSRGMVPKPNAARSLQFGSDSEEEGAAMPGSEAAGTKADTRRHTRPRSLAKPKSCATRNRTGTSASSSLWPVNPLHHVHHSSRRRAVPCIAPLPFVPGCWQ